MAYAFAVPDRGMPDRLMEFAHVEQFRKKFFPSVERQNVINSLIFISRSEVERITGMSRSWIYQAMTENNFPRPVPCTKTTRRWVLSEVQTWMQEKLEERDVLEKKKSHIHSNNKSAEQQSAT